jgi:hypothetical protein
MTLILFPGKRSAACIAHVEAGGQALEQWDKSYTMTPTAPRCFKGKDFAKLYDDNACRLRATARRLGVRVVKIDHPGEPGKQHVDLVGRPMRRALAEAVPAPRKRQPSEICRGMGGAATGPPCCARAGEYNGYSSGPLLFTCPAHCGCHD